jgi:RNA-binding protein Nova
VAPARAAHSQRAHLALPAPPTRAVLLLSGSINALLTALHLLLSKLADEELAAAASASGVTVKVVLPNAVCGAVVGKEGATIRSYTEDSGAAIKLSNKDATPPGVTDRVVSISGSLEQALRATALVVTRAVEEPGYPPTIARPYTYAPTAGGGAFGAMGMGMFAGGRMPALGMLPGVASPHAHANGSRGGEGATSVVVAVPDEHVGAIIGRNGATINEMQAVSGVSIKVSGRDDVVAHTGHRKVTLTGTPEAVQVAQFLVSQKVSQSVLEMEARRSR